MDWHTATSPEIAAMTEHVRKEAIPERLSDSLKDYDVAPATTQLDWYGSFPDQYAGLLLCQSHCS